ncbi:MAG: hypothetical protein AAF602_14070 [Myxococcota bacterium]
MPRSRVCFVIMPYGEKPVGSGTVDFDEVLEKVLVPAGRLANFEIRRTDLRADRGVITASMFDDIFQADLAVVDVTAHNPNVFYELGIRHALCKHGTVLVYRRDVPQRRSFWGRAAAAPKVDLPFDVKDVAAFGYDMASDSAREESIKGLADLMSQRHSARNSDSPVFTHIPTLRIGTGSRPAPGHDGRAYVINDALRRRTSKRVGYRSGDIAELTVESGMAVDYWVNSENTMMQMARMHERAMSATIRYRGAREPDPRRDDYEDTIQDALTAELEGRHIVDPGTVLVTTSGKLRETHGVKAILHAAAVTGRPGKGFSPLDDDGLVEIVRTVIGTARRLIREGDEALAGTSIILPLFGTGQGRRDPSTIAGQLIQAAIDALSIEQPDLGERDLTAVWFSAFTEDDVSRMRRLCEAYVAEGTLAPA